MKSGRVDFYDPLYDFVTFEEAARPRGRSFLDVAFARTNARTHGESISPLKDAKAILPFLSSLEFTRQGFLRQSNLAFLVYPSASHTRLSHAVGACYLGFLACQRVAVGSGLKGRLHGSPIYLSQFLEETGWREEFYLALLLHDVGHFPFSHALESNKELWDAFGGALSHEEAACQLIVGKGPVYAASLRRVNAILPMKRSTISQLAQLFAGNSDIDRDAVCYLIEGSDKRIGHKRTTRQKAQLRVVHALVSGLLDLDRIDHYRRDNYFTGLRTGTSLNYASLLSGLTIVYEPQEPSWAPQLRLSLSAVGHAISLLQSKERLTEDCFEHPDNVAYEAMLHRAVNMYILGDDYYLPGASSVIEKARRELVYDLLVDTDDQLLCRLESEGSGDVKETVFRIRHRAPYRLVGKLSLPPEHKWNPQDVRCAFTQIEGIRAADVVVRVGKHFGERDFSRRSDEWLDLDRLTNVDGKRLVEGRYRRQIEHFKQPEDGVRDVVWIYCGDEKRIKKMKDALRVVGDELGAQRED